MQCGPEYKLPGLYVVDSIVRQSRHQFGTEKDVFGPRFSKNFEKTFRNLFLCTPSDQVRMYVHGLYTFLTVSYYLSKEATSTLVFMIMTNFSAQDNESPELVAEE